MRGLKSRLKGRSPSPERPRAGEVLGVGTANPLPTSYGVWERACLRMFPNKLNHFLFINYSPHLHTHERSTRQGCPQDVKSQDRDETETFLFSNSQDRDETETLNP